MIAFNGTYLSAASHGNYRITEAAIGGQWVMGGWLKTTTQQAIITAFGAEGYEVIHLTNAYITLTDPTRAQQIANFINEDPLLVCSLVETSKMRWLVGDGKAYVDTGVTLNELAFVSGAYIGMQLKWTNFSSNRFQVNGWGNNPQIGISVFDGQARWQNYATGSELVSLNKEYNVTLDLEPSKAVLYCDGFSPLTAGANTAPNNYPFLIGCMTTDGVNRINPAIMDIGKLVIENDQPLREMYPFIRNGENGMLDILSGTFYPNANTSGAFTIQLTDKEK